ncbi:MAG: hypothetical protein JST00_11225 [Deltaproteobacteria bacterium]|nr:hypothetical protein [Deltaproteobacteria bacterium]
MRSTLLRVALSVALLATASPALAKDPTPDEIDRARTFFNAGAQAYAAARYGDAARSFLQAYELAPRPQLAFSLAQAERKEFYASNDASYLRRAIQHYKEYLDQTPSGGRRSEATEAKADLEARLARLDPKDAAAVVTPAPAEKKKARVTVYSPTPGARASLDGGPPQVLPYFGDLPPGRHKIRVFADGYFDEERDVSGDQVGDQPLDLPLKDRPAQLSVVLNRTADVYVDGRIVATTPLARPIEVPPGPHVISISALGKRRFTQEVTLERGKPFKLEPAMETSGQRVAAWSLVTVGAASMVTGAAFGIVALGQESRANDVLDARSTGNISGDRLDAYNTSVERRDDFKYAAAGLWFGGAAVIVGGVLLWFIDKPAVQVVPPRSVEPTPPPKETPIDVTAFPILGPGGTWGAGVGARF